VIATNLLRIGDLFVNAPQVCNSVYCADRFGTSGGFGAVTSISSRNRLRMMHSSVEGIFVGIRNKC
jgi:hypothetical protein